MVKNSVNQEWFQHLQSSGLLEKFSWLLPLRTSVNKIANFGCWSSEPFALLWILDASKIVVTELDPNTLDKEFGPREELKILSQAIPNSLDGRSVEFIVANMTLQVEGLLSNHFDLTFCQDVLYMMGDDLQLVQLAINEMTRVIKSGRWVIAVEPKLGAEFETISQDLFGTKIDFPKRVSNSLDISALFKASGLIKYDLPDAPEWSYCYQKPANQE